MDFDQNRIYFSHQNLASQQQAQDGEDDTATGLSDPFDITDGGSAVNMNAVRRHLREFLRNYRINTNRYIYRDKLINAHRRGRRSIEVDLGHVSEYDTALLGLLLRRPADTLPVFEAAALDCLRTTLYTMRGTDGDADDNEQQQNQQNQQTDAQGTTTIHAAHNQDDDNANTDNTNNDNNPNSIQILLTGNTNPTDLRQITARHMNRLVQCPGIVISAARIRSRARLVRIRCTRCQDSRTLTIAGSYSGATLPLQCMGSEPQECKQCPYEIVPDECVYVDQQTLKLQEAPELVPTGEMPRTILVSAERALVDVAPPGTRVHVMGIVSLFTNSNNSSSKSSSNSSSKQVYLRAVGMSKNANANGGGNTSTTTSFTPAEQEAFRELSRVPFEQLYQIMTHSIAPSISGSYTLDLKRAMACQLFGGSFKQLPESNHMRLRGDINVLLMGDPSTAKSQFLKFIERVAPVGVYTSGKGSSAAGLTASVVRDSRGEFYLEGGAMVLADGGIVCIDEFDKMRPQDRVAIHEAMEQQTISVAKAGITTVLNSRCSVLAAANPVFGRYDDLRSASENIDLMTTILSRFDLIFIVRDVRDEERDKAICRHVMGVHMANTNTAMDAATTSPSTERASAMDDVNGNNDSSDNNGSSSSRIAEQAMKVAKAAVVSSSSSSSSSTADSGEAQNHPQQQRLDIHTLKKYVQYCRAKCAPRLSKQASEVLSSAYVKIRDDVRKKDGGNGSAGNKHNAVPITVRQLEALVRISESLAKMRLAPEATTDDVAEALRLFRVSTMAASNADAQSVQSNIVAAASGNSGEDVQRIETFLRSRIAVQSVVSRKRIVEEAAAQGYDFYGVARAIAVMVMRGEVQEKSQGRLLKRII